MYEQFKKERKEIIARQNTPDTWKKTHDWMFAQNMWKYSYNFEWLGRPIIQYPQDIVAFQELIWKVKPDLIIETGIAHGGSLMLSASFLTMLEYADAVVNKEKVLDIEKPKRMVLGIDIEIREHNKKFIQEHPFSNRIKTIEGSSIVKDVVDRVYEYAKGFKKVLVCLDSNHTHAHVLEELKLYSPLISVGSYCIVFDTVVEYMPDEACSHRPWGKGNNPYTAVHEFLKENNNFEIDKEIQNKLLMTVAPDGYLKRVK